MAQKIEIRTWEKPWLTTFSEFYRDLGTADVPEFISRFVHMPVDVSVDTDFHD